MVLFAALDIGGTKLAAATVDADGLVREVRRCPTPTGLSAEELFGTAVGLVESLDLDGAVALGVGCGGPMDADTVSPLNIPAWRRFPLRERLVGHFGMPVVVDNDAKAVALGEGWVGAAAGTRNYMGMVVSTGVGGGIVLDGRLLHGHDTNAGHVGHVIVEPGGNICGCGARGCAEAHGSGTAIGRAWAQVIESRGESRGEGRGWDEGQVVTAQAVTAEMAAAAAEAGDRDAIAVFDAAGRAIGRAIASVANLLDLRLVVVGGGVAAVGDLIFVPMRAEAAACARLDHSRALRIEPAALGADAGLVGAASLVRGQAGGSAPA